MPEPAQSFSHHTRWHTPYHFVLFPILFIHFAWCILRVTKAPTLDHFEQLLLSVGLLLMMLLLPQRRCGAVGNDRIPSGNVVLTENGVMIGKKTLDNAGQASFAYLFTVTGGRNIAASYEGDTSVDVQ